MINTTASHSSTIQNDIARPRVFVGNISEIITHGMGPSDAAKLATYNGENGSPIYIAHGGKVYDVSESKLWSNGVHMKRHRAGKDLTADIQATNGVVHAIDTVLIPEWFDEWFKMSEIVDDPLDPFDF